MTFSSSRLRSWLEKNLNFFRIHLLVFTFVPLVASAILYGVNGEYHIRERRLQGLLDLPDFDALFAAYIDCLFLSYSAFTVTGLSTVNLSTMTGFQQTILFVLMICGDMVCPS